MDTAGHTKAFDYPVIQTRLDISRSLITQSYTDTAGHTKAFDYPVIQTRLDISRSLITQSYIDTAGHIKVSDYPVTHADTARHTKLRYLITQSHRHGWTYQGF